MFALIHLQAAMALGIFLLLICLFILCVILPLLMFFVTRNIISGKKQKNYGLKTKDYVFAFLQGCVYSVFIVSCGAFLLYLFLVALFKDAIL